jgi:hypothetical protein
MHYQTRHLEALADFAHGQTQVRKGDRFPASEIDAKFYVDRGRARDVTEEQAAAAAAAAARRPATASIGDADRPVKRASPTPEHARAPAKRAANATGHGHAVSPMTAADVRPGDATPAAGATTATPDSAASTDGKP